MPAPKISVTDSSFRNAYQLAEAASEAGGLSRFYCSLDDASGFWGRLLRNVAGKGATVNCGGGHRLCGEVREYPWPMVRKRLGDRFIRGPKPDWFDANDRFDRWSAAQLASDACELLIGTETCAEHSLKAARSLGKRSLLDCPQFHPKYLWELLAEAAERCALPPPGPIDSPRMAQRKEVEFHSADSLLVYSEAHALSFERAGFDRARIHVHALWFDPRMWPVASAPRPRTPGVLKVLFVGAASLRKGIPFLLQAVRACAPRVKLTLAGPIEDSMMPLITAHSDWCEAVGPQSKQALQHLYAAHDLLAMPSVADAYGLVAMEAMACGTPALVSHQCGVPVPEPSWRVPSNDAEALRQRFEHYLQSPDLIETDGAQAAEFAKRFTAEHFRAEMRECYRQILGKTSL